MLQNRELNPTFILGKNQFLINELELIQKFCRRVGRIVGSSRKVEKSAPKPGLMGRKDIHPQFLWITLLKRYGWTPECD